MKINGVDESQTPSARYNEENYNDNCGDCNNHNDFWINHKNTGGIAIKCS